MTNARSSSRIKWSASTLGFAAHKTGIYASFKRENAALKGKLLMNGTVACVFFKLFETRFCLYKQDHDKWH